MFPIHSKFNDFPLLTNRWKAETKRQIFTVRINGVLSLCSQGGSSRKKHLNNHSFTMLFVHRNSHLTHFHPNFLLYWELQKNWLVKQTLKWGSILETCSVLDKMQIIFIEETCTHSQPTRMTRNSIINLLSQWIELLSPRKAVNDKGTNSCVLLSITDS